jgi:hypothetical protein
MKPNNGPQVGYFRIISSFLVVQKFNFLDLIVSKDRFQAVREESLTLPSVDITTLDLQWLQVCEVKVT